MVILAGHPPGTVRSTNLIRVHRLGEEDLSDRRLWYLALTDSNPYQSPLGLGRAPPAVSHLPNRRSQRVSLATDEAGPRYARGARRRAGWCLVVPAPTVPAVPVPAVVFAVVVVIPVTPVPVAVPVRVPAGWIRCEHLCNSHRDPFPTRWGRTLPDASPAWLIGRQRTWMSCLGEFPGNFQAISRKGSVDERSPTWNS